MNRISHIADSENALIILVGEELGIKTIGV